MSGYYCCAKCGDPAASKLDGLCHNCMEQALADTMVTTLEQKDEIASLRAALERVEWVWKKQEGGYEAQVCLWCGCRKEPFGHAPDCERQKALGLSTAARPE